MTDEAPIQAPACSGVIASGGGALGAQTEPCLATVANGAALSSSSVIGELANGNGLSAPTSSGTDPIAAGQDGLTLTCNPSAISGAGASVASPCVNQGAINGDSTPMSAGSIPCASNSGSLGRHIAAVTIGGGRFVYFGSDGLLYKASGPLSLPAHGFLKTAVTEGAEAQVWQSGLLNGLSGLVPGNQYWLGADGQPTNTEPASGILQPIGTATEETVLAVDIEPQIILA